jgi:flavin reductase (DIM6/NTAB) family NADH-FMN oxidoreductase RutF
MKAYDKKDFPAGNIRRFLEPGPIVLVSSAWKGKTNIMTMGWHMVMEFQPSLIGCYIWTENHSFDLVRHSKECVINIPTVDLAPEVVDIGNTSGRDMDKFAKFGLTAVPGDKVKAPLIAECFANFECKLVDASLIRKYSLFVLEVVKAHAATSPKYPKTIHYRGDGVFMIAGTNTSRYRERFRREMLRWRGPYGRRDMMRCPHGAAGEGCARSARRR